MNDSFLYVTTAIVTLMVCTSAAALFIRYRTNEWKFLLKVFFVGLLVRVAFGLFVQVFDFQIFFGGDATIYDEYGYELYQTWFEGVPPSDYLAQATRPDAPGWGMFYIVAIIYSFTGRNILAGYFFCSVIGAATAPMVYQCAYKIFDNKQVGKTAAIMVAVLPALVIWSSQLMKDGLIIFLLVLVMTLVLELQERFSNTSLFLLIGALFGILSLRFYIFYMVVLAVIGSFFVGSGSSDQSIIKRGIAIVIIAFGLAYLGATRNVTESFDAYGSLERIQNSKNNLATSAESGFGGDVDVSTAEGALTAIPVGFVYLMFAPFPWQVSNVRQAISLPEVLLWWAMMPFLVTGLWYTIVNRLRRAIPVLLFTILLTVTYSIVQGNVGTAYRQRTQIQVFFYIAVAVGWTLRKERKENRKLENALIARRVRQSIAMNR